MGALNFVLPFTVFLYLLPVLNAYDLGKVATIADELNLIDIIDDVPKEIYGDNGEIELQFLDNSLNPVIISKPIISKDPTKVNVGVQAKVESKHPLNPIRGGISTNVQLANQPKWSPNGHVLLGEIKEFSSEEEWIKSPREEKRNVPLLYVPDITNILREKSGKTSMQLGVDVGVTSKKDTENVDKIDTLIIDNRSREKKNYIRLCKRVTDGSSLVQKLRGKDCIKFPRSEFYLDPNLRKKDDTMFQLITMN